MKKYTQVLLSVLFAVIMSFALIMNSTALSTTAVNWYVKKNSDHTQPPLDPILKFTENYNCYYVDKNRCDPNSEKVIYLTFDAGYENGNVGKIIDALKKHNAHAAFFILEYLITKETDLVKRMAADGHLVCNHTQKHHDMSKYTDYETFTKELLGLEEVCRQYIGCEMAKYYRPPEGKFSEMNLKFTDDMGYKTIFWSFAYADWDNNKQMSESEAIDKILKNTHNGAIILLHPTSATNAAIMDKLLSAWESEGYRFGSLDELGKK